MAVVKVCMRSGVLERLGSGGDSALKNALLLFN
jgi:hypothetical protein